MNDIKEIYILIVGYSTIAFGVGVIVGVLLHEACVRFRRRGVDEEEERREFAGNGEE